MAIVIKDDEKLTKAVGLYVLDSHRFIAAVLQKRNASINKRYRNALKSLRKRIRIMYEIA